MRGQIDPAGYGKKKKWPSHDRPERPKTLEDIDTLVDEVRGEVMRVLFGPDWEEKGSPYSSSEWRWFDRAKACDLGDIMEASAIIETASHYDEIPDSLSMKKNPDYDEKRWGELREQFQGAIYRNCYCEKWA